MVAFFTAVFVEGHEVVLRITNHPGVPNRRRLSGGWGQRLGVYDREGSP
jgi:hypothetical protein